MSLQVKPVTFVTDQCLLKQRSGKTWVFSVWHVSKWEQFLKVRTYISPWISFRPKKLIQMNLLTLYGELFKVVTNRLKVKRDQLLKSLKWPITWPGSMWSLISFFFKERFQFRWLNIRGIYTTFLISLRLLSNHLK